MESLLFEILFILLTSWAPICIYACGIYENVGDYQRDLQISKYAGNICAQFIARTCYYGSYIVGYLILYTMVIIYFVNDQTDKTLLTWIFVLYGTITFFTIGRAMDRHGYTLVGTRNGRNLYRRHRFSVIGRVKDALEEKRRKKLIKKRQTLKRMSTNPQLTEAELLRIIARMTRIDSKLEEDYIEPDDSDLDDFEDAKPFNNGREKLNLII
jgi:hypothetical protein